MYSTRHSQSPKRTLGTISRTKPYQRDKRVESLNNQLAQELHGNIDSLMIETVSPQRILAHIANGASVKSNTDVSDVIIHGRSRKRPFSLIQFKLEFNLAAYASLSVCQIRAADSGEPQRSHQTRVSVQVVEVPKESENPPVFKTNNQSVEVTESDEVGFLVALVQATDKDGDSLWYDIIGESYYLHFTLSFALSKYQDKSNFEEKSCTIVAFFSDFCYFQQILMSVSFRM